jgi:hypothetical protein
LELAGAALDEEIDRCRRLINRVEQTSWAVSPTNASWQD